MTPHQFVWLKVELQDGQKITKHFFLNLSVLLSDVLKITLVIVLKPYICH